MKKPVWTVKNIGDLTGKVIIVTGANSGLGFEATKIFASKGATIIMACRSIERANEAKNAIVLRQETAKLDVMKLDLGNLKSINDFVLEYKSKYSKLDILLNNAGIMTVPYGKTDDGFELQNGVNHLGHFALTAQLFDLIKETPDSRIVNVSSIAHKSAKIDLEDYLYETTKYSKFKSYGRSKLSNLLFTYELDRRVKAKGINVKVLAAHPGVASTDLGRYIGSAKWAQPLMKLILKVLPSAYHGSLPEVRASVDIYAKSGEYYGPRTFFKMSGRTLLTKSSKRSHDLETAKGLWELSEKLTGVKFTV